MIVQELNRQECFDILVRNRTGHLACARDNLPYIVPIHYALEGETLYMFSLEGQKIAYLRSNPNTCLQVQENAESRQWKSVLVLGRYTELAEQGGEQDYAWGVLQKRASWWEPGALRPASLQTGSKPVPIYFSIGIDLISGRRAVDEV